MRCNFLLPTKRKHGRELQGMKRKYFFDHIYKAGGSSVDRAFAHWLDEDQVTPTLVETATSAQARYADKAYITGHFTFSPGQWFAADRYLLTLLRDPVDRIISHYYFSRNHVTLKGKDRAVALAKNLRIEEYVLCDDPDVRNQIENFQTRHFAPAAWDGAEELTPARQLELAKASLDRYDLVGVLQDIDDFFLALACDLDLPPLAETPHANATRQRASISEVDAALRRRIESMNESDLELHDVARGLFAAKRRDLLRRSYHLLKFHRNAIDDREASGEGEPIGAANGSEKKTERFSELGTRECEVLWATVAGHTTQLPVLFTGEMCRLTIAFRAHRTIEALNVGFSILDQGERVIFGTNSYSLGKSIRVECGGENCIQYIFRCDIGPGQYSVSVTLHPAMVLDSRIYHLRTQVAKFEVAGNIGYHSEGLAKLYPTITGSGASNPDQSRLQMRDTEADWPRAQRIAVINPPLADFRATISALGSVSYVEPNELFLLEVEIGNDGTETWQSGGFFPVRVSYHWCREDGTISEFDGERTQLPWDIQPGQSVRLWANIKAPTALGKYLLKMTLVQDGVAWFDAKSGAQDAIQIRVGLSPQLARAE
jgi:hypothetical protein